MAIWPFRRKKKQAEASSAPEKVVEESSQAPVETTATDNEAPKVSEELAADNAPGTETSAPEIRVADGVQVLTDYDPINGSTGPFDGDNVNIDDFDFSDFSQATLNLGSVRIPLPKESQVQVEMGEQGPKMVHIVTRFGRLTPVAFAAPRTGGLWQESSEEIIEGMRSEGMPVEIEQGPWGQEIVGTGTNGVIRIIGVEGPRWLYRVTLAAPAGSEDQLAELGRETVARSFVYRGEDPILAGNSLPVVLPEQLAKQVQEAVEARARQAQGEQEAPAEGNPNALSDALQKIIAQNAEGQKQLREFREAQRAQREAGRGKTE